nr:MAG TPA: hypothetical protein [Caudoviricetes sp.]
MQSTAIYTYIYIIRKKRKSLPAATERDGRAIFPPQTLHIYNTTSGAEKQG